MNAGLQGCVILVHSGAVKHTLGLLAKKFGDIMEPQCSNTMSTEGSLLCPSDMIDSMGKGGTVLQVWRTDHSDGSQESLFGLLLKEDSNRSLNIKNVVAVGFDMNYTLVQYKSETFESLAYEGKVKKLVHNMAYPKELLRWWFDWKYMSED